MVYTNSPQQFGLTIHVFRSMCHAGSILEKNIVETQKERINRCAAYSLAIDEITDISDAAQLVMFVRRVTDTFEINK